MPLTKRQREALFWWSKGKSCWDTGKIIGRSEHVCNYHRRAIRARYHSSVMVQCLLRALKAGDVTIDELLDEDHGDE
jgi:DNA-binding CsgD family transcriptional regulator